MESFPGGDLNSDSGLEIFRRARFQKEMSFFNLNRARESRNVSTERNFQMDKTQRPGWTWKTRNPVRQN
jgi:hypothetical protein